ncbi:MAG TPA: glycoside hydrolase family 3 N-terminal domain-containing protein, partial [Candidatus Udaeobacter sp.]|nr:glycoside hydrolase family 3 N-terminal domain-containing protein [Candidatus Udaeobacter sp.]
TGLLRDELGFKGLAVSDGLEMRALMNARSLVDNAVLALAAGCDALCIGGGLAGEGTVDELVRGIAGAVASGRLSLDRLAEAAGRVDELAAARTDRPAPAGDSSAAGMAAARLAVRPEGLVRVGDEAVVVRLHAPISIAAGEVPWGLAAALAGRGVKVEAIDIDGGPPDVDGITGRATGKSMVVVARGLHSESPEARTVEALIARRPDTVVVDMGWPGWRPPRAKGYVATHGSARVCGLAAAEVLRP